jgi:superfamily I DNA/RNA helicase
MNEPSDEQLFVINQLKTQKNVIVDAIAGSGKSTTILSVAKAFISINILQMTYNSMLRLEIKEKTKVLQIENIEVHTFHSLAKKYYMLSAHTDTAIRYILFNNTKPRIDIPLFQLIVLDETQDMSFLYFQFMLKFSKDMGGSFQLLILGDYKQGLYEFKGADTRFLTMSEQIWELHPQLINKDFVR